FVAIGAAAYMPPVLPIRRICVRGVGGRPVFNSLGNLSSSPSPRYTSLFYFPTVNAVEFQGVSKSYAIYDAPGDRLKELLSLNRLKRHKDFWALHDVSFQVKRGETFCVVGENGSGKSTLLQMVAGILHPSSGTVAVNGRVSALLELGAGFNPEFSGRDNVYLNGSILGLSTRQIDARFHDIETF